MRLFLLAVTFWGLCLAPGKGSALGASVPRSPSTELLLGAKKERGGGALRPAQLPAVSPALAARGARRNEVDPAASRRMPRRAGGRCQRALPRWAGVGPPAAGRGMRELPAERCRRAPRSASFA